MTQPSNQRPPAVATARVNTVLDTLEERVNHFLASKNYAIADYVMNNYERHLDLLWHAGEYEQVAPRLTYLTKYREQRTRQQYHGKA